MYNESFFFNFLVLPHQIPNTPAISRHNSHCHAHSSTRCSTTTTAAANAAALSPCGAQHPLCQLLLHLILVRLLRQSSYVCASPDAPELRSWKPWKFHGGSCRCSSRPTSHHPTATLSARSPAQRIVPQSGEYAAHAAIAGRGCG